MSSRLVYFAISALILVLDLISKIIVRLRIAPYDSIPVLPGLFRLVHTENSGAAFGMLADGHPLLRSVILVGVSLLVMGVVAASLWSRETLTRPLVAKLGLALILGGASGNMYDRLVRGTVTDFLEVYQGTWTFPAFNVADSAITVGAALLILDLLRPRPNQQALPPVTK